jgi:membrane fusion protein, multidrug efflux system
MIMSSDERKMLRIVGASGWPAALAGLAWFVSISGSSAQGVPAPAVSVVPVISREIVDTASFIGRIVAIDKVDIVARVPGFIEQRFFTEGQLVKTGDLLFRIEQATYKAAVEQQEANLAKARATETNAAVQLERGKELVRGQNIPQSTFDQRAADAGTAKAEVLVAEAALKQAQINLDYTEVHAPIDGRIGLANHTVGNLVGPSSGILATIVSQDPIYVIFQATERDILEYKRRLAADSGQSPHVVVHIKLPDGTIYPEPGLSNFLDNQVGNSTDTVAVRAQFPNPQGLLTAGGFVTATVERGAPKSELVVPLSAVQVDQAGRYVLVVSGDKKVEQRRVTTGTEQGTEVAVIDGLKQGENVIVEGIQKVRPGQVVAATPAAGL